tara:strand:- start:2871 stop:3656 length:786 start_codon:yes stop_codon:yes gene_type:complete
MNTTDFTHLLHHSTTLNKVQVGNISNVVQEFPYFQSARAIYLKGLKDLGSFKYNQELKTTSAYTTDRSILFDFITSDIFLQSDISTNIKQNFDQIKTIKINEFQDISKLKISAKNLENKDRENLTILKLGKPLEFDKNETHSFSEWLSLSQKKPIDRSETLSKSKDSRRDKKFAIIDEFIANKPKLKPLDKDSKFINIAEERVIETESLMTETLARIYAEQKNYDKAIQSYQILSLKYPEKSSLFADQIQAIKVLKRKNNL